jgi:hypothetical protein
MENAPDRTTLDNTYTYTHREALERGRYREINVEGTGSPSQRVNSLNYHRIIRTNSISNSRDQDMRIISIPNQDNYRRNKSNYISSDTYHQNVLSSSSNQINRHSSNDISNCSGDHHSSIPPSSSIHAHSNFHVNNINSAYVGKNGKPRGFMIIQKFVKGKAPIDKSLWTSLRSI